MLNSLKKLFKQTEDVSESSSDDLHLLCGLMIEAANIDGNIEQQELDKISKLLIDTFNEDANLVEVELKKCILEINEHKSLHYYTSKINKSFSTEKKILLIQILWEIILVDNKVHDYESNLIRRLSGLFYISDIDSGNAKKKALENLKIET